MLYLDILLCSSFVNQLRSQGVLRMQTKVCVFLFHINDIFKLLLCLVLCYQLGAVVVGGFPGGASGKEPACQCR